MKRKLLALAALILPVCGAFAQGTWVPQNTGFPQTSTGVFNISVVDENIVWISSYDGAGTNQNYRDFSVTIDGGATWIPNVVPAPAGHAWSMIHGLDAQTAWAVMYNATAGSGGGIWKTTDGGVTWTQQGAGQIYATAGQSFPNVVHFWDANTGFAMGDPVNGVYELYTTTNGGTTWTAVPSANIPAPTAGEYGIVDHYSVVGDTIWWDTNKGRVFRSVDKGLTWTVSSTGITVPTNQAMDLVFWNSNEGLVRLFNGTTGAQTARRTTDGGLTWTAFTPVGNMLGNDIKYVPGTASRLVSTGANAAYVIGSSFSDDGGLNWTDIEIGTQRTALGVHDINTMWAGGFTTSPSSDGIFKYQTLAVVACGDPTINPGIMTAPDLTICFGDTLFLVNNGAVSPNVGTTYGYSAIVSTNDISGNPNPLGPGVVGGTGIVYPVPAAVNTTLINNGNPFAAGVYYFTPVVYGNATGTGNVFNLTLDPACTYTGVSVMVTLYAAGDPACSVGLEESGNNLALSVFQSQGMLNLNINSLSSRNLQVTVFDVAGRMAANQNIDVASGRNLHQMDISGLAQGTYAVRVSDSQGAATVKFVKY
jgi:hypothetical protein